MPTKTDAVRYPARPVLWTVEPQVFVTDLPRALAFYTQKLGFTVGYVYGDPPFYAQVVRDGAMMTSATSISPRSIARQDRTCSRRPSPPATPGSFFWSTKRRGFNSAKP